ncbi:Sugar (pentulose and hexulose) kinase [Gaiella occulta]|uniref:Sugar (Pentulose and hexulose) kinase n=1 Tax=Gaiella occulta TaxID=1002870 RepID=A0A7M2Z0J3_9ACTN|nr:rhamnulokinase family protein [Gaiella occulta]RDI75811.1 Sugar (pentulose and hexulose) kinase [Gaiella occulta]
MATMVSVDVGAQSGRVALGRFDGETLSVAEIHRFPNVPVCVHGTLHWDALRLHDGILQGLRAAAREAGGRIDSVGVDTWGLDFALLDRAGRLVQNPVHHRDRRTDGAMEEVFARVPAQELYERTGIQLMSINSVFQLWSMAAAGDPALEVAETFLMMPDLFHYWLSGVKACEFTAATTSQCFDPRKGVWALDVLERLGVSSRLFPEVVPPGTVLGPVRDEVVEETRLQGAVVVAPASHDTGSAVAAVPFRHPGSAYISSGTWSLVGVEVAAPVIDDRTFSANLTNEGGVGGTFRLLRNVTGLWLLHECRRAWALEGREWEFAELVAMAEQAPPPRSFIDPNEPAFLPPGDMPARIREFCVRTGQEAPAEPAVVVRCVLESLALKYRQTIGLLDAATGVAPAEIHVVGGGAMNRPLCQWTADATGLPVIAGPVEAAEIGNLAVQAMALGELASLDEAREVVRNSFSPAVYEPHDRGPWEDAYGRFDALVQAPATRPEPLVGGRGVIEPAQR